MNIVKATTVGIDKPIQNFQTYLYGKLTDTWTLSDSNSLFTGRCYKNQVEEGVIAEIYLGSNEYKEVFLDDTKKAQMFFVVDDERNFSDTTIIGTNVSIIFIVNAEKIYPDGRYDEEIRNDVLKLLDTDLLGFTFTSLETGIDNVFREFSGSRINVGMKYRDMHPFHCFRLNFNLTYTKDLC